MKILIVSVVFTVVLVLSATGNVVAQGKETAKPATTNSSTPQDEAKQKVKSPLEIAKMIAEQGKAVSLGQSKTEVKIEKSDPVYQFREGESRAVLVRLPEYSKPYILRIFSGGSGFMTIRAFAPIAVVLDSEFAQLDTNKIEFEGRIGNKRKVFVTEGKVDDTWRTAKYIFFYTNGGLIGKEAHREGGSTTTVSTGTATVTNVPVLPVVFLRSATGHLKFEISQVNQKDSSSAKPSEGIVKSVQTATKIDRKTFSMSLPIGWKEDKKDDMYNPDSTVFFENPEPCLFLVIIRKKSAGASVDSLLTAQKSSWQSKFTDTKIMDISKWANYEGKGFEIEGKFQGIRLSRSRIFGFENADKVSIIIEFAALNDFKTCASDYEEIRQTFKLK